MTKDKRPEEEGTSKTRRKPAEIFWMQDQEELKILNYITVSAKGMGVGVVPEETIKLCR